MRGSVLYLGIDEAEARRCLSALRRAGIAASRARSGTEALRLFLAAEIAILVYDLPGPDSDTLGLVKQATQAGVTVLAITAPAHVPTAFRHGAWDVVRRTERQHARDLVRLVERAIESRQQRHGSGSLALAADPVAGRARQPPPDRVPDEVVHAIAHELKNPIGAVLGYSEILAASDGADSEVVDVALRIESNARRLLTLVDNLIDTMRAHGGSLSLAATATDVNQLVRGEVDRVTAGATGGRRITFRPATLLPTVALDRVRIVRLVDSLLISMLSATAAGGEVLVRTAVESRRVVVSFRNDGSPSTHNIAAPRRLSAASVVTIALARALVGAHGGEVLLDSGNGHDLALSITFPVDEARFASVS